MHTFDEQWVGCQSFYPHVTPGTTKRIRMKFGIGSSTPKSCRADCFVLLCFYKKLRP
jgi:hypothetical protein